MVAVGKMERTFPSGGSPVTRRRSYRGRVSALGGGRLGIDLPKDLLESVGWRRGTKLRLTPLTKKKIVVEVDE